MINIGLNKKLTKELANRLNHLLADYMIFYQNARGLHWNIRGEKFFELHVKFEELYNNLFLKIDEIAERILTLDGTPLHTFDDFMKVADVKVTKNVTGATPSVKSVLDAFSIILEKQREILVLASEAGDEGTNAMMSDYIREQEKLVWMYNAYIGK
ncbi:MAG: DNA starvation/stationary phase protection protein [Bacteroidetes bacterium]|jgi:starvation-inducible DNA-binding protein|nr:DNA starvation/stationary phase protection protein [Bacteroidota bacterium]